MSETEYVVEATAENFDTVVLARSHEAPVLVDFWAEWCGPCKMLMPILDKLVHEYQGKFTLAKIDTERQQQLAAAHGIRSIPTLKLYKDGQQVEELHGALPEPSLRELIERHIVRESDLLRRQARESVEAGDPQQALDVLDRAQAMEPDNYDIAVDRLRILIQQHQFEQARALLQTLPINITERGDVSALMSELDFAEAAAAAPPPADLEQRLEHNPGDSEARFALAARLVSQQDFEGALEHLLLLLQRDRKFGEDAGRRGMIAVFNLLGDNHPLVAQYRRRMFNALH